jgi:hypothetical protein
MNYDAGTEAKVSSPFYHISGQIPLTIVNQ